MRRRTKRNQAVGFKARVAIKSDKTQAELTSNCDGHPNQIPEWKQRLPEFAAEVIGGVRQD